MAVVFRTPAYRIDSYSSLIQTAEVTGLQFTVRAAHLVRVASTDDRIQSPTRLRVCWIVLKRRADGEVRYWVGLVENRPVRAFRAARKAQGRRVGENGELTFENPSVLTVTLL
ncbi:MAG: hypothetical protein ACI8QS_000885 [Planctomycetota bacterium]|jgi:hypothetical protein